MGVESSLGASASAAGGSRRGGARSAGCRAGAVVAWSDETVERIVAAHPEEFRVLPTIGSAAGLRQGELFGLSVDDFDFGLMLIRVRRQLKRLGKEFVFALPMNDKERFVPRSPVLAKAVCLGSDSTARSRTTS